MEVYILYLLRVNILLTFCYLFYLIFLKRLSLFQGNRVYFISCCIVSFAAPIVRLQRGNSNENHGIIQFINNCPKLDISLPTSSRLEILPKIIFSVIVLGTACLLVLMIIRILAVQRIRRKSSTIVYNNYLLRVPSEDLAPFSFFKTIFFNPYQLQENEKEQILAHELVHINQNHTIDILVFHLTQAIIWFNPFVWLLKKEVLLNLEFIADKQMLDQGYALQKYELCLLKIAANQNKPLPVATFGTIALKQRIFQMNRVRSSSSLWPFFLTAPMVIFLQVLINGPTNKAGSIQVASDFGANKIQNVTSSWRARVDGNLTIIINGKNTATINGIDGYVEARNIDDLVLKNYSNGWLYIKNRKYSLKEYSREMRRMRQKITYIYLGSYAMEMYKSALPIIIVEPINAQ